VYAGFFVFNNVIRPLRLGLSIAISTYFDQVVAWVQRKTKLNKSLSIGVVVFLFNIVGTISLMCLGISLASLASGVPVFPSKAAL
jgi:small basic protein